MTDRSKTRVFPLIELHNIRDLHTGEYIEANRLIEKYIRSVATQGQVLNIIPATVTLGVVLESRFIDILPDRSVQVKYTDFYDFSCVITANSSSQNKLTVWVEVYDPLTTLWTPFPESGRTRNYSNNNGGGVEFTTKLTLEAGFRFRFRAKCSTGTLTLGDAPIDAGGVSVGIPAVVFTMSRI